MQNLDKDISLKYIKKIAEFINKNITDLNDFRKVPVYIRGAEHIPPEASYVPIEMSNLIYKEKKLREEDIFDYIASFHIRFERIHPFEDGNGRTGRLLITKELLSRGYAPIVIPLDFRAEYFKYLADQNIIGLGSKFRKLNAVEIERLNKFGIKV